MISLPQKSLTIAVVSILLFFLSFNFIFQSSSLKNFFYNNSSGIQKTLWQKSQAAIAFSKSYFLSWQLDEENKKLSVENQQLSARLAEYNALVNENNSLRQALSLGPKEKYSLAPCQIVSKESVGDFIVIDAGLKQGIKPNQTVVSQDGVLVGKVEQVYGDFSRVMLISNTKSVIDAGVQGKDFYALVKGQGDMKMSLDLVDKDKDVKEGDMITTSALGGLFPADIAMGKIIKVQKQAAASFLQIEVEPLFKLEGLGGFFVIKNFEPLN